MNDSCWPTCSNVSERLERAFKCRWLTREYKIISVFDLLLSLAVCSIEYTQRQQVGGSAKSGDRLECLCVYTGFNLKLSAMLSERGMRNRHIRHFLFGHLDRLALVRLANPHENEQEYEYEIY